MCLLLLGFNHHPEQIYLLDKRHGRLLKAFKILSGLRICFRFAFGLGSWSKRPVGNVHAHKELVGQLRPHLLQVGLLLMVSLERLSFGHQGHQLTSLVMCGQAT